MEGSALACAGFGDEGGEPAEWSSRITIMARGGGQGSAPTTTSGAGGGYPISTHRPREEAKPEGMERWSTRDHRSGLDFCRGVRRREIRRQRCEVRGGVLRLYRAWGCGCFFIHVIGGVGARCVTASDASGRPCWSITVTELVRTMNFMQLGFSREHKGYLRWVDL
jgi:hypothetical protein